MEQREPEEPDEFLLRFHQAHSGCTSGAFSGGRIDGAGSSYDLLVGCAADATVDEGMILDLGCGDGYLLELLVRGGVASSSLLGVDMSDAELTLARRRPGLHGARLIEARAQSLPLGDNSVDVVLSHLAWMLMSDVTEVVSEVRRVLRPGGVFAAVVGGGPKVGDAFELFLDLLAAVVRRAGIRTPRLGDARCRTRSGLGELLGLAAGFERLSVTDHAVDLSGSVDAVWDSLCTVYEMHGLPSNLAVDLRKQFKEKAEALTVAGRVPCSMFVRQVVAR